MRIRLLATAAAAIGTVAALPAAAQQGPFTGARVEVLAGYDNIQDGGDGDSEGREGFGYGVGLGYDFGRGGAIFGIEGEVTDATTKARSYNEFVAGDRFSIEAGRDFYVGGRVGAVISPLAMVYAKAGYTNARIQSEYTSGTTELRDDVDVDGFRVGAGLEYAFSPSAFVKGEYRYSHYGEIEGYDIDLDRHQLMAGVGFRF